MARITINGIEIDYACVGDEAAPLVILTPGGRYAKEYAGVPQLADKLAEGGKRVLLWDRPNCGASDISFDGASESVMHAEILVGLVKALGLTQFALAGGSAGSRISLLSAVRMPERVSHIFIWWISGGPISLAQLAGYYCGDVAMAAVHGGMEGVANHPIFAEPIARNPRNRGLILKWDADAFIAQMQLWAKGYAYSETSPVPGISDAEIASLTMPTMVLRSGKSDLFHTRDTSEKVAALLPNAQLHEPPWPDSEWNDVSKIAAAPGRGRFERWPLLAPMMLDFLRGS
jgi:pimeloyl-ACP methyl ester carboxylesterase